MITKQELEEKIAKGESVWYADFNKVFECVLIPKNKPELKMPNYLYVYADDEYEYRRKLYINRLYSTKVEAEHYLHHANIIRTETLPFLTWEEFFSIGVMTFTGTNNLDYELVRDFGVYNAITIYENGNELFEYDLTEENFYKAYDECVKLFKGEENK